MENSEKITIEETICWDSEDFFAIGIQIELLPGWSTLRARN